MKKIYLGIIFTVIGSLIALGWALDQVVETNMEEGAPGEFLLYQKVLQGMSNGLSQLESEQLSSQVRRFAEQFQLAVNLEEVANLALPAELAEELTRSNMLALQSESETYFLFRIPNHPDYLLQMSLPAENADRPFLDIALTVLLYLGISLALVVWLVPLTTRLSLLNKIAAKFGQGQLDVRITPSRLSYISGLEQSFNRMAAQIEKLVADNKLLAGSLSHDLRTPVACLRFGVEAALDTDDQVQKKHFLMRVEDELTRMENMLEAFLEYASMERQGMLLKPGSHELNALITGVVNEMSPLGQQKQVVIDYKPWKDNLILTIDHHWFYRALLNLISNALDYAQSKIVIELKADGQQVLMSVHDDGPGIPSEQQGSIFDAFVTIDESRNRQSTNFGLGLAIVKRVVDWHGGKANVSTSSLLKGACFTLSYPQKSPLL